MELRVEPAGIVARLLAVVSLVLGLGDAITLLGVESGDANPLALLGPAGFTVLAALCIARLFAAVGLWMQVRWGAVLLAGALAVEIALHLSGSLWVSLGLIGFLFKLVVLLATIGLLVLAHLLTTRQSQD